ncbi:MAG: hypothetical protein R2769_05120 [Saprospiraceae bacterium]
MYAHTPVYNGMGDPNWSPIPGTNSPSYDPGPINQSTYYLRCSRRVGCTDYIGETNIVSKIIKDLPTAFISVSPQQACTNTGTGFEAQDIVLEQFIHGFSRMEILQESMEGLHRQLAGQQLV